MTFITPVDGQPAIAAHVAQLTNALTGVTAEPITLTSTLTLGAAAAAAGALRLPNTAKVSWRNAANTADLTLGPDASNILQLSTHLQVGGSVISGDHQAGSVYPDGDNTRSSGLPTSNRWNAVYAVNGTIQTSSAELKAGITPLDPAQCQTAVLETDWVAFSYLPPAGMNAALLAATAPARHQKGYVLQSPEHRVHALFGLEDRVSVSPSSDLAVVAAALQHALARIAALEAALEGAAPA